MMVSLWSFIFSLFEKLGFFIGKLETFSLGWHGNFVAQRRKAVIIIKF